MVEIMTGVLIVLSLILAVLIPWIIFGSPKINDSDSEYRPVELDEEETLAILSGKQELCGNHVNWLNEKQGLPMMTMADGDTASASAKLYQYHRVENHARDMGWID